MVENHRIMTYENLGSTVCVSSYNGSLNERIEGGIY